MAEFIGEECIRSLEIAIKAAKGESIDEPEDIDKKMSLLDQKIKGIGEEEITNGKSHSDPDELEKDLRETWLSKPKAVNRFKFNAKLMGFKKSGMDTFDINKGFTIQFEQYKYVLSYSPGKPTLDYPYHKRINDRDIEEISTSIFDQVFRVKPICIWAGNIA